MANDVNEYSGEFGLKTPPMYLNSGTAESRVRSQAAQRTLGSMTPDDFFAKYAPTPEQQEASKASAITPVASEPIPAPQESQSNFGRGFDVSGKQLSQAFYGTTALIGDTIGADSMKQWGLKGYKEKEAEIQKISKESDSFTNMMEGKGTFGDWMAYSGGYLTGQVAESVGMGVDRKSTRLNSSHT